jgi:hypothetical protein
MEKSLYIIKEEYLDLISQIEQAEGELTTELESALTINKAELEVKSIAYVEFIKSNESYIERINQEIERLKNIKKASENVNEKLKANLLHAVNTFGSFNSGFLKFSTQKSKSIDVNIPINELPKEYKNIKVVETADKIALKKAIENGEQINGVQLIENINLRIK